MRLATVALADAVGATLVHTTRAGDRTLTKGCVLDAGALAALADAGIAEVLCARLASDELAEDPAAAAIAHALAGAHVRAEVARAGRANLRATAAGVLVVDRDTIMRANAVDEAITVATLAAAQPVRAGDIVATVKIIPFGVAASAVAAARTGATVPLAIAPWRRHRAGLILTQLPATRAAILDRAAAALRARLARLDSDLIAELRVDHEVAPVAAAIQQAAAAGCDPILALGASAIMDRRDTIPAALERAGGTITRFGMPVDPGNLLLLGALGDATFIGMPGCARSLARSGFDWVLERVCAGLAVDSAAISRLGLGGLLDGQGLPPAGSTAGWRCGSLDDTARPTPRDRAHQHGLPRPVAAIVLAAGRGSRMGGNKLVAELDGQPLVRHAVLAALASPARPVVVVTGNEPERIAAALAGLDVELVHNPAFATGMASSLRAGIAAVPDAAGALICLGDMPRVTADHLAALIASFADADDDGAIIVPTLDGAGDRKRGNPVLWGRGRFAELAELDGDVGARALVERHLDAVHWVAIDDPAILLDVDTPLALARITTA